MSLVFNSITKFNKKNGFAPSSIYLHGELENMFGNDGVVFVEDITELFNRLMKFIKFKTECVCFIDGVEIKCTLYVWFIKGANSFIMKGLVVKNDDIVGKKYAQNVYLNNDYII